MKLMKLQPSSFPGLVGAACGRARVCRVKETEEGARKRVRGLSRKEKYS